MLESEPVFSSSSASSSSSGSFSSSSSSALLYLVLPCVGTAVFLALALWATGCFFTGVASLVGVGFAFFTVDGLDWDLGGSSVGLGVGVIWALAPPPTVCWRVPCFLAGVEVGCLSSKPGVTSLISIVCNRCWAS